MSRRHRRTEPATEDPHGDEEDAGRGPRVAAPAAARQPFAGVPLQPAHESDALVALVQGMPAGSRLGLERVRPDYAKGWCTTIELPHGATIDYVLDVVRESWGGGTYRLKPLTDRGQWAEGAVTVNIAGEPLFKGNRYNRDGTIDDGTRPPASQQQWYPSPPPAARAAQPAAAPDNPQIVTALSGLVQSLAGNQTAEVRAKLDEVTAALRTAPQVAPPAPVDGFGEVRKSLELLRSLKELAGDLFDGGGGDDAPAPAAAPPMDPQMMQMMQMMGMGGGGAPGMPGMPGMPFGAMPFAMPKKSEDLMLMLAMQWMQQRNQPQGGQWVQGPNGAPVYVVPIQTPQGMQWMPVQQPPQQAAPMWQPPPQQQPQQAPAQPPPQQAAPMWQPPPQQRAAPPVVDVEAHTARPQPHDEPEQLTPRDVLEQLERMDPEQAARFFDEVGSNLPPHVQGALVAMMQRMQQQQQPAPPPQQPQRSNVVGMSPFALSYEHDK